MFLEVNCGGVGGGRSPPHLLLVKWEEGERKDFILNYIETRQLEEGRRENVEWEEGRPCR